MELCYDTLTYSKSLILRHSSRYSVLNGPVADGMEKKSAASFLIEMRYSFIFALK